MTAITDDYMKAMLGNAKDYTVLILKKGPNNAIAQRPQIVWEHGRRNFELRAQGLLSVVCPVMEDNDVRGIGIFNCNKEKVKEIMDRDPGVQQGVFVYEILAVKSFPGDALG